MSSSVRTPSPSLRSPRTFLPVCLAQNVSMPCQRVREKGKSHVILQHAVHIHTFRACDARCTPGFGSPLSTHFGLVVVPRWLTPLHSWTTAHRREQRGKTRLRIDSRRVHQQGQERVGWRSFGGHGRTEELVDNSPHSRKPRQRYRSLRIRTSSSDARSVVSRKIQRCTKSCERTVPQQRGLASLPHVKLAPVGAPGPTGETQEHLDAIVAFAGARQRKRLFRVS